MENDFDENGNLVIDDVPDEIVAEIGRRAAMRRLTVDEELRFIMTEAFSPEKRSSDFA
jgi:plasmid stability protein